MNKGLLTCFALAFFYTPFNDARAYDNAEIATKGLRPVGLFDVHYGDWRALRKNVHEIDKLAGQMSGEHSSSELHSPWLLPPADLTRERISPERPRPPLGASETRPWWNCGKAVKLGTGWVENWPG